MNIIDHIPPLGSSIFNVTLRVEPNSKISFGTDGRQELTHHVRILVDRPERFSAGIAGQVNVNVIRPPVKPCGKGHPELEVRCFLVCDWLQ
jgi:hypothetical protein